MTTTLPETGWRHTKYGSGSQTVGCGLPGMPWLYISAGICDATIDMHVRHSMCQDIQAYLNGAGPHPVWLADMERVGEDKIIGTDGTEIVAAGPMYDRNPPSLDWWTRDDDEAKGLRARLVDRLWLTETGAM